MGNTSLLQSLYIWGNRFRDGQGPAQGPQLVSGGPGPRNCRLRATPAFLCCRNMVQVASGQKVAATCVSTVVQGASERRLGVRLFPKLWEPRELLAGLNGCYRTGFPLRLDNKHSLDHPHRPPVPTQECVPPLVADISQHLPSSPLASPVMLKSCLHWQCHLPLSDLQSSSTLHSSHVPSTEPGSAGL